MEKNKKQALIFSIVGVLTLIALVVGATYAYFKAQGGEGGSSDVNVITATTDLLTFKIDKAINISISQSELKKDGTDASDSTGAHATLTASNSKNVEKTTRSYNIYFVIDTNDFEYTTQDGTPELYLNVTDPNGNSLENITGLVHYEKGFDITTRTGGFLLVPDYDIEATRGNTITQDWKVEVTFANLDTDQSKNMGKSLSGKLFVTSDKMNSYELSKITNMTTKTTYNSIDTTLEVEQGTADVNKYFYGIEKVSSNVTGYVNNGTVKKVALKDVTFVETDKNTYKFDNLSDNSVYKVYSYGVDKNGIKTNLYETEVTTSEYNNPVVNSVSHTSTLNSITLSVNATKGDNDIVKYYYSKDNGQTYEESDTNSYVFNNLKDTTEYKIKVKVLDSYGRYSTEFVKAISTETYILPSVTSVTPTTKYNQISVSVVGANGTNNISKYYYSINDGAYTESTNSSYTFTGLNEKTNYSIKVKVVDTLGKESNVYSLSVKTDAYVLPKVTNVSTSSTSSLNTYLNNEFITTFDETTKGKIEKATWKVGGNTRENIEYQPAKTAYQNEVVQPITDEYSTETEYSAKVGLMYVSDYGFAAAPSAWTVNLSSYSRSDILSTNWMFLDTYEWTITRSTNNLITAFFVSHDGAIEYNCVNLDFKIRPVFNLISSTTYVSGDGTKTEPIRIN